MTGRRKSCETCKKVAATSSLPFMEMSVPLVDGVIYQNTDHEEENRTPGFRMHTADAISYPVTPGVAVAGPSLGRTEPTPGFRKTAKLRKAAIQASSFTAVAKEATQEMNVANHEVDNEDAGKNSDKNDNCSYGDNKDPKGGAGCSDPRAYKAEVAVHVAAVPTGAIQSAHIGSVPAPVADSSRVTPVTETTNAVDVDGGNKLVLLSKKGESASHSSASPTEPELREHINAVQELFKVNGKIINPFDGLGLNAFSEELGDKNLAHTNPDMQDFMMAVVECYRYAEPQKTMREIVDDINKHRKHGYTSTIFLHYTSSRFWTKTRSVFNDELVFVKELLRHLAVDILLHDLREGASPPTVTSGDPPNEKITYHGAYNFKYWFKDVLDCDLKATKSKDEEGFEVPRLGSKGKTFSLLDHKFLPKAVIQNFVYEDKDVVEHFLFGELEGEPLWYDEGLKKHGGLLKKTRHDPLNKSPKPERNGGEESLPKIVGRPMVHDGEQQKKNTEQNNKGEGDDRSRIENKGGRQKENTEQNNKGEGDDCDTISPILALMESP